MKIISVVWDEEEDTVSVNHEGCNHFEAIGLLSYAVDVLNFGIGVEAEDGSEEG